MILPGIEATYYVMTTIAITTARDADVRKYQTILSETRDKTEGFFTH